MTHTDVGWIPFASIGRAHGVRGEVRLSLFHDGGSLPLELDRVRLVPKAGAPRVVSIANVRPVAGAWLVLFEGISDREAARAMAGSVVEIRRDELPSLEDGEFYFFELLGARAQSTSGEELGTVSEILALPGQDVLVLQNGEVERLVPLVESFVCRWDRAASVVLLRLPEDLFGDEP